MKKILVFDMDGTIADFYGVPNWLQSLENFKTDPYENAKPLVDMIELRRLLMKLKTKGYKVVITSWASKGALSNTDYFERIKKAKIDWLKKYAFPADAVNVIPYGTDKNICTVEHKTFQILFDDEARNRDTWLWGMAPDITKTNILHILDCLL